MGRWQPGAQDRLGRAALELFLERGFEETTVPQITERAGLTTRTFFRYFADKREVLFADDDEMPALAEDLLARAPATMAPMPVIAWGLPRVTSAFEDRLDFLRARRRIVETSVGLRERELHKFADLSDSIARGFQARGVDEVTAALAAETAVGVVKISLQHWLDDGGDLAAVVEQTMNALRVLTTGPGPATAPRRSRKVPPAADPSPLRKSPTVRG